MDVKIPEYMKGAQLTATDEAATPSLNFLSFNLNRQFLLKQGSDEKKLGQEVNIVVLAVDPPKPFVNARAYWPGDYGTAEQGQPECASPDGIAPFDNVQNRQAERCDKCKWSALGSKIGSKGASGKSAQCKAFKMVYFVFENELKGGVVAFRVPITSLKQFSQYRWDIRQLGVPIAGVVTKVSFDDDAEYTKPTFSFSRFLDEQGYKLATELAVSAEIAQLSGSNRQVAAIAAPVEEDRQNDETSSTHALNDNTLDDTPDAEPSNEAIDIDAFLNGDIQDTHPYDIVKDAISACASVEDIKAYLAVAKDEMAKLTDEEKAQIKALIAEKASAKPEDKIKSALFAITKKEDLPDILDKIRSLPDGGGISLKADFIKVADKLNGESWSVDKHGESKDKFPAIAKDGSYKKKRNASQDDAVNTEATAMPDLDDIMGMLDKV